MRSEEMDAWIKRMEEGSFLPSDDPLRLELERDLSSQPSRLREKWLEILAETESLKLKTLDISVPKHLEQRLLNDLEELPAPLKTRKTPTWMLAAACLFAGVLIGFALNHQQEQPPFQQVVLLAADDHINDRRLAVSTSDLDEFERVIKANHQLPVAFPTPAPGFKLVGGRVCHWGQERIVYSLWKKDGLAYSLIQFDAQGMNMPPSQKPCLTCCDDGITSQQPMDLVVWVEQGRGYALVGRQGSVDPEPWSGTYL
jgi:hypothetical protein